MKTYNHLSYEDRKNIEDGLNDNKSINQIAKEINRSHSSILREIYRNKVYSKPNNWCTNKNMKILVIIFIVINLINHLMFVMVVNLEVVVERKDLHIMLEKRTILIKKLKVRLEKV